MAQALAQLGFDTQQWWDRWSAPGLPYLPARLPADDAARQVIEAVVRAVCAAFGVPDPSSVPLKRVGGPKRQMLSSALAELEGAAAA